MTSSQMVLLGGEIELAYGKGLSKQTRLPGSFPVYGSNGKVDSHNHFLVEGPGIIVGRKGSVGEVIWADDDFWPIDTTYYVKLKNKKDSLRYWYYQLKILGLNKLNSHSAIPGLNREAAYAKQIIKRSPEQQGRIATVLGSIDEKIELNRRMNETLEQMGQALFRNYFITNQKAEGWSDGMVSDLVNIYSGFAFKSSDFGPNGKYGLVTIKNVQDGVFITECTDRIANPSSLKTPGYAYLGSGDIILSLTGNVGRACLVVGDNYLLNQRVAKLEGKNNQQAYAYFLFRSPEMKERLLSISRGTAQMNLSPVETKRLKVKLPPDATLADFNIASKFILEKILSNSQEIHTLTTLRDTLLPRLISGRLSV